MDYPGGFITKTAPTLNPALGNAAPGVWRLNDVLKNIKAGTWPSYDPYFDYTTLLLHGNGTNGGQNNTFLDSSSNNFTITRNGNTTQGTFSPFSVGAGYWSAFFAGGASGGYITSSTSADYTFGTGDFTIEGFVFVTGTGTGIFQQATSNFPLSTTNTVALGTNGGTPTWQMYAKNTSTNSTATWAANNWYHFAVVRSGTTTTLYINGSSVITVTGDSTNYTGTNFGIGSIYGTGSSERFTGYLSNLRVVKGAAVYTANFTPPTSPLTSFGSGTTALIALQSNRYIDTSASPKTLTVTGDTSVQAFSPFAPTAAYSASTVGGSGYFDGSGDYLALPDNAAFDLGLSSQAFTIETFFYPTTTTTGYQMLFARGGGAAAWNGTDGWQYAFFLYNNSLYFQFWSGSGLVSMSGSLSAAQIANQFNHLVVSYDGSNVSIFANGARLSTTTSALGKPTTSNITQVGKSVVSAETYYPTGYIASLRVVKGTAVYSPTQTTYTVPTAPLTNITNTSLLLNFTNAAIIDNTAKNVLETVADAQISTTQSKFGGASLYFDGTGDLLVGRNSDLLQLASGPFTIEFWYRTNTLSPSNFGYACIVGMQQNSATNGWGVWQLNQTILFFINGGASNYATGNVLTSTSVWYHVAVTRDSSNNMKTFIDGVQQGSQASVSFSNNATQPLTVGGINTSTGWNENYYVNGYIDDLRITKGIARYTSNFTPQTSQWQDQ